MESRNMDTLKTPTTEVVVEKQKANHARRGNRQSPRVDRQIAIEKQAQLEPGIKAVYRSPEVRAEKVEALRAQIEAGTYHINRTSLAMKLLGITEQDAG